MTDDLLQRKGANALYREAEIIPLPWLRFLDPFADIIYRAIIKRLTQYYDGLWVGGSIFLYQDRLRFAPNILNRRLLKKGSIDPVEIPLESITSAYRKFGVLSGIISVAYGDSLFIFRCFGAKAFAAEIERAVAARNSN